jgi:ribosomal protein L21E
LNRDDFRPGDLVEISDDFVPAFPESLYMGCLGVVMGPGKTGLGVSVLVEGAVRQFSAYELRIVEKSVSL